MVVHMCGQACEMAAIYALSINYGFKIIEDASHAIGAQYKNEPVGNCRYSHITVFSFHPVKIITSGEGGMAVSNDATLAKRMRLMRSHGITSDVEDMQPRQRGEIWNYQQVDLGFNYRMTDMQAALGLSQMKRLNAFVVKRHELAQRYDELLTNTPVVIPWQHVDGYSAYHQLEIYNAMLAFGVAVNLHYIPVYRQPYYENMGFHTGYCPQAECYYAEAITIPMYPELTDAQQEHVVVKLKEILAA